MNNTVPEKSKNNELVVYLDMDGVLVNFEGGYLQLSKGLPLKEYAHQFGDQSARDNYLNAGVQFWAGLEWIRGGREVWDTASRLFERVCILSSAGTTDPIKGEVVRQGKLQWLKKHIPSLPEERIFIVGGKHRKQEHASRNGILVDDVPSTIQQWNAKGGYGILHHDGSYKKTLEELEDLAKPIKLGEIAKRYQT